MSLCFSLSGCEELLSALSFIILERLLLRLLALQGYLLLKLLRFKFSGASFFFHFTFNLPVNVCL